MFGNSINPFFNQRFTVNNGIASGNANTNTSSIGNSDGWEQFPMNSGGSDAVVSSTTAAITADTEVGE